MLQKIIEVLDKNSHIFRLHSKLFRVHSKIFSVVPKKIWVYSYLPVRLNRQLWRPKIWLKC